MKTKAKQRLKDLKEEYLGNEIKWAELKKVYRLNVRCNTINHRLKKCIQCVLETFTLFD